MGGQESKTESPEKAEPTKTEHTEAAPTTPILTPLDPRSPSSNIARTPLELILDPKTAEETRSVDVDNKVTTGDEVLESYVLETDPRSPTLEFTRTPIVVVVTEKHQDDASDDTPIKSTRDSQNMRKKLLVSKSCGTYVRRKSCVGLLETNVDFQETDLDTVCKQTSDLNVSLPVPINDNIASPITNKLKVQMEVLPPDLKLTGYSDSADNTFEATEQTKISAERKPVNSNTISDEKSINVTAQVKDFDKKLTNLIYQDEGEGDSKPSLKYSRVKEGSRTPLGVRNCNEEWKKHKRLKVSDKPKKEVSKIPVFKDNYMRKSGIQCENTPPQKTEDKGVKTKFSRWDGDKTMII